MVTDCGVDHLVVPGAHGVQVGPPIRGLLERELDKLSGQGAVAVAHHARVAEQVPGVHGEARGQFPGRV